MRLAAGSVLKCTLLGRAPALGAARVTRFAARATPKGMPLDVEILHAVACSRLADKEDRRLSLRLSIECHQRKRVESGDERVDLSLPRRLLRNRDGIATRLILLRRSEEALSTGAYTPIAAEGDLVVYTRGGRLLVVLNLGDQPMHTQFAADSFEGRIALSTELDREGEPMFGELGLRANEGVIVALRSE
jgi:hypothetical protein